MQKKKVIITNFGLPLTRRNHTESSDKVYTVVYISLYMMTTNRTYTSMKGTQLEFTFTWLGALQAYNKAQLKHMDTMYMESLDMAGLVHTDGLYNSWAKTYAFNGGAEAFRKENGPSYFNNVVETQNMRIAASAPFLKRVKNNLEDKL